MASSNAKVLDGAELQRLAFSNPVQCIKELTLKLVLAANANIASVNLNAEDMDGCFIESVTGRTIHDMKITLKMGTGGHDSGKEQEDTDLEYVERIFCVDVQDEHVFYIRVTGMYDSWVGTIWHSEMSVVYPHTVTRTEFLDHPWYMNTK
jgi:hypothetical protein